MLRLDGQQNLFKGLMVKRKPNRFKCPVIHQSDISDHCLQLTISSKLSNINALILIRIKEYVHEVPDVNEWSVTNEGYDVNKGSDICAWKRWCKGEKSWYFASYVWVSSKQNMSASDFDFVQMFLASVLGWQGEKSSVVFVMDFANEYSDRKKHYAIRWLWSNQNDTFLIHWLLKGWCWPINILLSRGTSPDN